MALEYLSGERIQGSSAAPITITDDLTSDKGWVANGTGNAYNAGNDNVDFKQVSPDASSGSNRDLVYIDVQDSDYLNGVNLNDTAFTVKCKVRFSAIEETGGGENRAYFGFYSDTAWGGTAQDFFYLQVFGKDNADPTLVLGYGNNSTFESAPNKNGTAFTAEPLINTNYYITWTKTGGTTYKIRVTTSSDYTGGQEMTATASSITGLRYFGWKGRGDTQDNGGNTQGYFDDISIESGTTDEKATISNIPVGTRYEETDTRKIFRRVIGKTFSQLSSDNNENLYAPTGSSRTEVGQSYQTGHVLVDKYVSKASWFLQRVGSTTGEIRAYVRKIDGTLIATGTYGGGTGLDASTLTTSYVEKTFDFPANTILNDYMLTVNSDELTSGQVDMDSLNADISNGVCYMKIGGVWSAITTAAIKMNVTYDSWVEKGTA